VTTADAYQLTRRRELVPWASRGATAVGRLRDRRAVDLGLNLAVLAALWVAYAAVRSMTAGEMEAAWLNAERVLAVQEALRLPGEAWLQGHALSATWLIRAANRFYLWVHFPGTAVFLAWAWSRRRAWYGRIRDALVLVTGVALVLHVVFPLAPPRMMPGFVDTGAVYGPSPYDLQAASAANQIAAMPSLHVGWALLIAIAVVGCCRSRWRWAVVAHPTVTTIVVVVTANHYWADAAVAAVLVVAGWWATSRVARFRGEGSPTQPAGTTGTDPLVVGLCPGRWRTPHRRRGERCHGRPDPAPRIVGQLSPSWGPVGRGRRRGDDGPVPVVRRGGTGTGVEAPGGGP
jgi:hypothetical protein